MGRVKSAVARREAGSDATNLSLYLEDIDKLVYTIEAQCYYIWLMTALKILQAYGTAPIRIELWSQPNFQFNDCLLVWKAGNKNKIMSPDLVVSTIPKDSLRQFIKHHEEINNAP